MFWGVVVVVKSEDYIKSNFTLNIAGKVKKAQKVNYNEISTAHCSTHLHYK